MFEKSANFLGVDLGDVRVGISIARSPTHIPVSFAQTTRPEAEKFILNTIKNEKITDLVIGVPLSDTGEITTQASKTEKFIERLRKRTEIPIHMVDEYGSSDEAQIRQRIMGGSIDTLSAVVILERYLGSQS